MRRFPRRHTASLPGFDWAGVDSAPPLCGYVHAAHRGKSSPAHLDGAVYGSPVKTRDGTTAFDNLFLAGTDQGFLGITGAMLSGISMANRHILAGG